jgi:hypothetical protein
MTAGKNYDNSLIKSTAVLLYTSIEVIKNVIFLALEFRIQRSGIQTIIGVQNPLQIWNPWGGIWNPMLRIRNTKKWIQSGRIQISSRLPHKV